MSAMNDQIIFEDVSKFYGEVLGVNRITLSIPPGHVVGLVGPNGAGKTTLLHIAAGLLPATSGRIEVLGGLPASGPEQLAKVGFVAQDNAVYSGLSVAERADEACSAR